MTEEEFTSEVEEKKCTFKDIKELFEEYATAIGIKQHYI